MNTQGTALLSSLWRCRKCDMYPRSAPADIGTFPREARHGFICFLEDNSRNNNCYSYKIYLYRQYLQRAKWSLSYFVTRVIITVSRGGSARSPFLLCTPGRCLSLVQGNRPPHLTSTMRDMNFIFRSERKGFDWTPMRDRRTWILHDSFSNFLVV